MILQEVFGILTVEFKDLSRCLDHQPEGGEGEQKSADVLGRNSKHAVPSPNPEHLALSIPSLDL
jgi:hypothetical protein